MRTALVIALAAALCVGAAAPASGYSVVSGHPRLYFRQDNLDVLREKCSGPMAADFNDLRNWCNENMNTSLPLSGPESYKGHLIAFSFAYVVTQDIAYAGRAKAVAQDAMTRGYSGDPSYTHGMAVFFDWCYDYLTSAERQNFGYEVGETGMDYAASHNWVQMNNYHSKLPRMKQLACAGLPIYGEGIHDSAAESLCDLFREHTFGADYAIACVDEIAVDGSYFQGDYTLSGLAGSFVEGNWLWRTATDEDPFAACGNLQNLAEYYLYEVFAKNGPGAGAHMSGSKQGDSFAHTAGAAPVRGAMHAVASVYQDPKAEWLAHEITNVGLGYINRNDRWLNIIYHDTSIVPEPPYDLSSSRLFGEMGTVYMRSGWDLSEYSADVYAVFRCERLRAGHTHAHQNHLLIARGNDLLAIDSGVYDGGLSAHHLNYFERTVAHNTVTIYDPSETTFESFANDGGQEPMQALPVRFGDASQPEFRRGEITAYSDTDTFTYMKGDATDAYSSHKLDSFTREIVYLKPNVFVVLDRVDATSASYEKKWLLHSIEAPSISGRTTTITEGGSKMVVTTLLPADATITAVGGPGREFEVEGTNYPPAQGWSRDMGAWRIEVEPGTSAEEHVFLHVIWVGGSGETPPAMSLVESADVMGARVGDGAAVFSVTGEELGTGTYEFEE